MEEIIDDLENLEKKLEKKYKELINEFTINNYNSDKLEFLAYLLDYHIHTKSLLFALKENRFP